MSLPAAVRAGARGIAAAVAVLLVCLVTLPALAAGPTFPPLTGRVVDDAHVLSPQSQADLSQKLAQLEASTGRQLVVVTLPSLQGYDIEDYGYQLGRAWGIGQKGQDNGVLFIVAPSERKTRVEVGYGLEPVLTDALSSVILQEQVLPRFRAGDMEGGVVAGTNALIQQLSLPDDQAKANVAAVRQPPAQRSVNPIGAIISLIFVFWILTSVLRAFGGRGAGCLGGWWMLPLFFSGGGRGWGGGGFGGGGGGFSGGGGSFGGGGASGSW